MRHHMHFDVEHRIGDTSAVYIQDTIHIGTKLRNRLLKPSIVLPMGNKQVSVTHLKLLLKNVSKNIHGLVRHDISPDDRQNYGSLEKVMKPRVLDAMASHIIDSEATVLFLKLCWNITSSFREVQISPIERIQRIWYGLYFLRIWREWIKGSKYSIVENFITLNAYACVEINAHGLIQILRKFRDADNDHLFFPMLFESQQCEQTFRQLRSMTTLNWTKVNFTLLQLTHMIGRIDLQNDIIYSKLKGTGIVFPRNTYNANCGPVSKLPTDAEIKECMQEAKLCAENDAKKLGMQISDQQISVCDLPTVNVNQLESTIFNDDENAEQDIYTFDEFDCDELSNALNMNLRLRAVPSAG